MLEVHRGFKRRASASMKRLDQLTDEDLREQLDSMMGVEACDGLIEGFDRVSLDDPHAALEAKELYDELNRLSRAEEKTQVSGRTPEEALRQPHYWQDKRTPFQIRARVWRKAGPYPRKLTED